MKILTPILLFLLAATGAAVAVWPLLPAVAGIDTLQPGFPTGQQPDPGATATVQPFMEKPRVEAVFVLDTTSSMSGLIEAAKQNIWSIATTLASAQPAPDLRLGLVAFRDKGDAFVTQVNDLTRDLDTLYVRLMDYRAEGGGDAPEHVNQALYDAVHRVSWSTEPGTYRVVFLVGDAPAHMDYQDDVKFAETLRVARERGIVVNTIQAGENAETTAQWQQIAQLNQGEFFRVSQGGDAVAISTPFDDQIARLSAEIDATRLYFGDAEARARQERKVAASDRLHEEASVVAKVRRALYNTTPAGKSNFAGEQELVDQVSSGAVDVQALPEAELPEELKKLPAAQRAAAITERAAKRGALQKEIDQLAAQREAYVKDELARMPAAAPSLDTQVFGTLRSQAKDKGLALEALRY